MPHIVETEVFEFDELSDSAKERAREWYRDGALDYDWWSFTYDDAARVAEILGIDLKQSPVKLMNGKTRYDPSIWFNGFYSQGSGSAFDGEYRYAKGCVQKIKEYAPQDAELHRIAQLLTDVQKTNFYRLRAAIRSNRDNWINVEVSDSEDLCRPLLRNDEEDLIQALRDFNHWIYQSLQREYEYLMSDERVDESIRANEYTFTEDGERF